MTKLAWVLMVLVAACGGSSSVDLADYPDAFHDAYCHYLVSCGEYGSFDTCSAANVHLNLHIDASSQAAIDMGKIKYDGGKAASCFDEIASQSCDQTSKDARTGGQDCRTLAVGTVHAGGACAIGDECISGMCNVPTCQEACCQGACMGDAAPVRVAIGQACDFNDCNDDAYCDTAAATPVCTAHKLANAACDYSGQCDYGLGCTGDTARTCQALPKLGEACPNLQCRDVGTRCVTGTCQAVATEGEACSTTVVCGELFTCDATQHCSIGVADGAACTSNNQCSGPSSFCNDANVCAPPQANGAACLSNNQCASYYCDDVTSQCAVEPVCI